MYGLEEDRKKKKKGKAHRGGFDAMMTEYVIDSVAMVFAEMYGDEEPTEAGDLCEEGVSEQMLLPGPG